MKQIDQLRTGFRNRIWQTNILQSNTPKAVLCRYFICQMTEDGIQVDDAVRYLRQRQKGVAQLRAILNDLAYALEVVVIHNSVIYFHPALVQYANWDWL